MKLKNLVRILRSMVVNYPVLDSLDCTLPMPIALLVQNPSDIMPFVRQLSRDPKIITASTKVETARDMILKANSEGVFFMMSEGFALNSMKMKEKIEMAYSAAGCGNIDGKATCAAVFFIFRQHMPEEFAGKVFILQMPELDYEEDEDIFALVPSDDQLAVVEDRIARCRSIGMVRTFQAAAWFLYPKLAEVGETGELEQLMDTVEEIVETASLYDDEEQIVALATERFFDYYLERGGMDFVFNLPQIEGDAEKQLESATYVAGDVMYLHEKLFRKIIAPLLDCIPIGTIKESLQKFGILTGNAGDYTSKMSFYGGDGKLQRRRMLKFNSNKIVQSDSVSLKMLLAN